MPAPLPAITEVAVIGAGFSGVGAAIRLGGEGADVVVLERAGEIGGTWESNTYPGCACDIPSHLYSYSFAPNPDWSHTYSAQPEIAAYLRGVAAAAGIRDRIHTGCEVTRATWEEEGARWRVETSRGIVRARVLVAGAGPFSAPRRPDVPGLERFAGALLPLRRVGPRLRPRRQARGGRRHGGVGDPDRAGDRAAGRAPARAPADAAVGDPAPCRAIGPRERRLYRTVPALRRLVRGGIYAGRELLVLGFAKRPALMGLLERTARAHLRRQVPDPALRRRLTPSYRLGCKRILPSNRWYPALQRPNVELVTDALAAVTERGIVTRGGMEIEVDAIVCATGFHVTDAPIAGLLHGRDGRSLADTWQGCPRAHLGTTVPGFPNLFLLLGPNTGQGHTSMIYMLESQLAHVAGAVRALRAGGLAAVEARPEAAAAWNAAVDARSRRSVWATGCASWYLDASGRNAALWPDWTFRFRRRLRRFEPAEYVLRPA